MIKYLSILLLGLIFITQSLGYEYYSIQQYNKNITVDNGINIFYRESGDKRKPVFLLLHGFPSSSHQYRNLMPLLSPYYRVIAPDLPGFGFTEVPASRNYTYTFDNLASTIRQFVDALNLNRFSIYVFDYGAPVGYRLALAYPDRITGIVSQNGNAYLEGMGPAWELIERYWNNKTQENRDALLPFLSFDLTKWQYTSGVPENRLKLIQPESYYLDAYLLTRPGNNDIQLDLFYDYKNNLSLYPQFQRFFKTHRNIPMLIIWGKNDQFFIPAGAQAYKKDNPFAEVELLDSGHLALETHLEYIAFRILQVL